MTPRPRVSGGPKRPFDGRTPRRALAKLVRTNERVQRPWPQHRTAAQRLFGLRSLRVSPLVVGLFASRSHLEGGWVSAVVCRGQFLVRDDERRIAKGRGWP